MTRKQLLAGAVATVVLGTLGACAGQDPTTDGASGRGPDAASHAMDLPDPPADADWNAADAEYLTMMTGHHRQAVEMSELARTRATSPAVRALAEGIGAGQGAEIVTMAAWLDARDLPVPTVAEARSMYGMGGMTGMLSPDQLEELAGASGAAFDRLFLERMVAHHEGALEMAQAEQAEGKEVTVVDMATEVVATQSAEISRMRDLLGA